MYSALTGMLVTTDLVVAHMNSLSEPKDMLPKALVFKEQENEELQAVVDEQDMNVEKEDGGQISDSSDSSDVNIEYDEEQNAGPESSRDYTDKNTEGNSSNGEEFVPQSPKRKSARVRGGVRKPERYEENGKAVHYRCYQC